MSDVRRTRVEDYLIAIDGECATTVEKRATTGSIASKLGVANGTASSMLKQLADDGLVDHLPYEGVLLTSAGQRRARLSYRRLRLLELHLIHAFGMTTDLAAEEAWRLEPGMSESLADTIDARLGHPTSDAEGNLIPLPDGSFPPDARHFP